jgi:hypothetical protein
LKPEPQADDPIAKKSEIRRDAADEPPLVVDLDNCLVKTDLLVESILLLIKRDPLAALRLPFWLLRGRSMRYGRRGCGERHLQRRR